MGDFLRLILDSIKYLWPFRLVQQWEKGGYYVCGRWWKEVGPGLKVVLPFFTEVMEVSCAPAIVGTAREDITMSNGTTLSFSATATVQVVDVYKALNAVEHYHESTQELIGSYLAERLAEVDPERLAPDKRRRLFGDLQRGLAAEAAEYGVEVSKLRFTSFVSSVKTYRLLIDQSGAAGW